MLQSKRLFVVSRVQGRRFRPLGADTYYDSRHPEAGILCLLKSTRVALSLFEVYRHRQDA
eukprot:7748327-Pyramimonas_sp.AAC.1